MSTVPKTKFFYSVWLLWNFSDLNLENSLELYKCAKAFADIVIPQVGSNQTTF